MPPTPGRSGRLGRLRGGDEFDPRVLPALPRGPGRPRRASPDRADVPDLLLEGRRFWPSRFFESPLPCLGPVVRRPRRGPGPAWFGGSDPGSRLGARRLEESSREVSRGPPDLPRALEPRPRPGPRLDRRFSSCRSERLSLRGRLVLPPSLLPLIPLSLEAPENAVPRLELGRSRHGAADRSKWL